MYEDFCNILNLIFNLLRKKKLNTPEHVSILLEEYKIDNIHFLLRIFQFLPINIGQNANEMNHNDNILYIILRIFVWREYSAISVTKKRSARIVQQDA